MSTAKQFILAVAVTTAWIAALGFVGAGDYEHELQVASEQAAPAEHGIVYDEENRVWLYTEMEK